MRAVILAGGKGTRLAPYTVVLPKPLLPLGDRPILEIVIRQLRRSGISEVTMAVGYLAELLEAYFGDGSRFGIPISYSREHEPLGTAGPLSLIDGLDDTFLVLNGDLLTTLDCAELVEFHRRKGAACTIAAHRRHVQISLGVLDVDGEGMLLDYTEKPSFDYLVSMGLYVFEPSVLEHVPKGNHLDFPDLIKKLLAADNQVATYRFGGYWLDIGQHDDYAKAMEDFEAMKDTLLDGGDGSR